jgi:HK97 family phage prohead protease
MNRMYSVLEVKSVDDDARVITGIATTPEPDRMSDVIEPMGVKFKNPLPLLWQHRTDQPVGHATFKKPTEAGIDFTAEIVKISEPGALKDLLDMAWQSVKAKLVRGVSIGFRPLEYSFMDNGGIRFVETEVIELSLVTIPANEQAKIQTIKSIDAMYRGAVPLVRLEKNDALPKGAVRLISP